jgi:DNA-directed RNA polymerase sigma subunit (sigma70/sigma32)
VARVYHGCEDAYGSEYYGHLGETAFDVVAKRVERLGDQEMVRRQRVTADDCQHDDDPHTLRAVGDAVGLSCQRVQQIEVKVLATLHERFS